MVWVFAVSRFHGDGFLPECVAIGTLKRDPSPDLELKCHPVRDLPTLVRKARRWARTETVLALAQRLHALLLEGRQDLPRPTPHPEEHSDAQRLRTEGPEKPREPVAPSSSAAPGAVQEPDPAAGLALEAEQEAAAAFERFRGVVWGPAVWAAVRILGPGPAAESLAWRVTCDAFLRTPEPPDRGKELAAFLIAVRNAALDEANRAGSDHDALPRPGRLVRIRLWSPRLLLPVIGVLAGCAGDRDTPSPDAEPAYTVSDSAGVEIVVSRSPLWERDDSWHLDASPSLEIGGAASEIGDLIWEVRGARRLSDGRLVVVSGGRTAPRLLIFDRKGELVRAIGRLGRGPGEFREPMHLQVLKGDTLVVWERFFGRITSYDTSGVLIGVRHLDLARARDVSGFGPEPDITQPLPDGSFIVRSSVADERPGESLDAGQSFRRRVAYTRVHRDYAADTLGIFASLEMIGVQHPDGSIIPQNRLMGGRSSVAAGGSPVTIFVTRGDANEVAVLSPDGSLVRIVRTDSPPPAFTADDREMVIQMTLEVNSWSRDLFPTPGMISPDRRPYPTHWPQFNWIHVDRSGYLWTSNRFLGRARSEWSVHDPQGRWLGRLVLPVGPLPYGSILDIGQDYLLVHHRDEMLVESIREYRLERTGLSPR